MCSLRAGQPASQPAMCLGGADLLHWLACYAVLFCAASTCVYSTKRPHAYTLLQSWAPWLAPHRRPTSQLESRSQWSKFLQHIAINR